jgi:23S rRNA (adenine2503-C2)-methyltransferase
VRELETVFSAFAADGVLRAKQVFSWINRGADSFREMTDIPLSFRKELECRFRLYGSSAAGRFEDGGTVKIRAVLEGGAVIEAVLLDDGRGRKTACLSTQVGCPVGCVFCKTGLLGFSRNLVVSEIVEQFFYLLREAKKGIGNIVVMGMGEPLFNLEALRPALERIAAAVPGGFSPRRVTVSTSGIAGGIREMAERGPRAELAFSLITAREELRRRLMPGAREPLKEIWEALVFFQKKQGRRVTLEIVLLSGINAGEEDALALAAFARGLFVMVNVIPWNPVPGLCFEGKALAGPSPNETGVFIRTLQSLGLTVTRRYRKGRSVLGACGQLGVLPGP